MTPEIERALRDALQRRNDRRQAEQALEVLRQKEADAMDRLQRLIEKGESTS